MARSIDTEDWKQEVRKMKSSCSQTILHIENRDLNLNNTLISDSERNNYQLCKNNDGKKVKIILFRPNIEQLTLNNKDNFV